MYGAECVCLCCLFFLSPRCRTPALPLGSGCRCCHWLFGHRRQLKPFNNPALFLAAVAGVALTDVYKSFSPARLCIIMLVMLFRRMLCCDLVRESCYLCLFFSVTINFPMCYTSISYLSSAVLVYSSLSTDLFCVEWFPLFRRVGYFRWILFCLSEGVISMSNASLWNPLRQ